MKRFWAMTALSLLLAALACSMAAAQQDMKLLAPGTGWVLGGNKLYWTTDNGENWTDITPPKSSPGQKIGSVYFKDTALGWAVLSSGESPQVRFELATTSDSGASWTVTPVELPPVSHWTPLLPGGEVFFLDRSQGWLAVSKDSGHFPAMLIFATDDGGETWVKKSMAPGGIMSFTSPGVGWVAGGPGGGYLYQTADGGASWQKITLSPPHALGEHAEPSYGAPVFVDSEHGFEATTYFGGGGPAAQVLFETDDGGRTWTPDRVLQGASGRYAGVGAVPSTVADSVWLTVRPGDHALTLVAVPLRANREQRTVTAQLPEKWAVPLQLSFVSATQGWASGRDLHATADGGATWKDVSPWPASPAAALFKAGLPAAYLQPPPVSKLAGRKREQAPALQNRHDHTSSNIQRTTPGSAGPEAPNPARIKL